MMLVDTSLVPQGCEQASGIHDSDVGTDEYQEESCDDPWGVQSLLSPNVALSCVALLPARIGTLTSPRPWNQRAEMQECHVSYSAWFDILCMFLQTLRDPNLDD